MCNKQQKIDLIFFYKPVEAINNISSTAHQNNMKKVLAILAINPEYVEFAVPELKALLSKLKIPFSTLFNESMPLPEHHYDLNYKALKNFPYITLNVPDFDKHRDYFELASRKAVMVSKFVLLISEGATYDQLIQNKDEEILNQECRDWNQHVICDFISRNRVIGREEQIKKIHQMFQKFDVRGKVDMKKATKRLQLIEQHKWYQNHHETNSDETLEKVYFGIELSSCKINKAKFNIKYQLGNRIYLGPTSADNDLAFLMCNQANIDQGSFVLDPFVGTAGLLIPPASNGATVFGCDLDMRVLNGYAVGRINKKSSYYSADKNLETYTPKIELNFDQYGLPRPNILRMDATKCAFAPHTQFDAIITDPPYGLRAMSRSMKKKEDTKVQVGETETMGEVQESKEQAEEPQDIKEKDIEPKIEQKQQKKNIQAEVVKATEAGDGALGGTTTNTVQKSQEELKLQQKKKQKKERLKQTRKKRNDMMSEEQKQFKSQVLQKLNRERIDNWNKFDKGVISNTQRQVIFEGLLSIARRHLKQEGRLVFLYPIYEDEEFKGVQSLPNHEGFEVVDMSQNVLSRNNSRILVTLEKK